MATPSNREVTQLAKELAHLSSARSSVFRMSWWNERLLEWALARPAFKAQLFRFVDVFPATRGNKDVLRHVQEYLGGDEVPSALRGAIDVAARVPFGASATARQARHNIARMADQFILGTTPAEAVQGVKALWDGGSAATVDLLGEKTVAEAEADAYAARVLATMAALAAAAPSWKACEVLESDDLGPLPRVSISIKPTALASKYKPLTSEKGLAQAKARLRPILRAAVERDVLVWFDMEHYEVKDLSIRLFRELIEEPELAGLHAGLVLQAYLRDTYRDLGDLIAWSARRPVPVHVRLVKGAYWDTETITAASMDWDVPVFQRKVESDANYERCARLLLDHHGEVRAAFASHNLRSLAFAIAYARKNGLPDNAFEVQMLYGMAEPMHEAIRRSGLRLRVYAPVGELVPGMAYLVRRLLENTSNDSFVRMRFAEGRALDELIAPPDVDRLPEPPEPAHRRATSVEGHTPYAPEPLAEWHRDDVRARMAAAVAAASGAPTIDVPALIDGKDVRTSSTIDSVDPAHPGKVVARSASCGAEHAGPAIEGALAAWPAWRDAPVERRAAVLFGAAEELRSKRFELAALQVVEAAKPWADADGDVCEAIDFCEYYGREALRLAEGGPVQSPPGEANALRYQPRGVAVVISPWNFPLAIPTGMVTAALVAGNAVVLKPSEQTPAVARCLVQALRSAGLPDGVLQFLPGRGEDVGAALVAHPQTSCIAFTGSKPVGLGIVEAAAKHQPGQRHIKRVIAELGGKNPMIVDSDADLDQAVPAIVHSAFGYAGQKCSALSRLIVLDSVADELVERLVGAIEGLTIGDPASMGTDVGPVIDDDARSRIRGIIDDAPRHGEVVISRTDLPSDGYFVAPTLVRGVDPASPLAKEEVFGPVLAVFSVPDIDAALALANDTDYALTAGLFSRSPSTIARVARDVRAGNVYVNRQITGAVVGRQPFGGWGLSGGGTKAGGPDYLLQFMDPKAITENTVRQGFAEL